MKEKYFDDFMSYKRKDDKYYDLGNWLLKVKKAIVDMILVSY